MPATLAHFDTLHGLIAAALDNYASWPRFRDTFQRVGLPYYDDLQGQGKQKFVRATLNRLLQDEVVAVAAQVAELIGNTRQATKIQDQLWWIECEGTATITEITRRSLTHYIDSIHFEGCLSLEEFRARVQGRSDQYEQFSQGGTVGGYRTSGSTIENNTSTVQSWGFLDWPDKRLFKFLEAMVDPVVRRGEEQRTQVDSINAILRENGERQGFQLAEVGITSGHPTYEVQPIRHGVRGRPKNLIFASTGPKPELGFSDAINCDVVVLRGAETTLFYDEPITKEGLLWAELVSWWSRKEGIADPHKARDELGQRLRASLPRTSPPSHLLFGAYFTAMKGRMGDKLPALVPEVYLHYDPVTLKDLRNRGEAKRFLNQRMDFLLLLRGGVRVVIEVDGESHYVETIDQTSRPSPRVYADTVRGDRELRLMGYDVYRFGGYELSGDHGKNLVSDFFLRLFQRHALL